MKIVTILGTRPQFIKAAPVSRAIAEHNESIAGSPSSIAHALSPIDEIILHTGQHYDWNMSRIFFNEMNIPEPHLNLDVGSGSHGRQTGEMLIRIEKVLQEEKPDWVLVYGDTNSTLAGALAACKLRIPLVHVEAGLRSRNREMPEEHNRVITDHCADLLLCPSQTAIDNLKREGIEDGVYLVGDTMYDAILQFLKIAKVRSKIINKLEINPGEYYLSTVHRPYNTDNPKTLAAILNAFLKLDKPVIFPVHPRTRQKIMDLKDICSLKLQPSIHMIEPVGYLDMLQLEMCAAMILTDSGGMQKEAYFLGVPCITLRTETEWVETVQAGWNMLVGNNSKEIVSAAIRFQPPNDRTELYGDGKAAKKCVRLLIDKNVMRTYLKKT